VWPGSNPTAFFLQLQRQRCSRLERFYVRTESFDFNLQRQLCKNLQCN
jgi:hypothetical protein